jgi:bifunctional NMN adenylyltransferase/nudix hydrolase
MFVSVVNFLLRKIGYHLQPTNKVYTPWPTAFSTVDIAVVDLDKREILLGCKKNKLNYCFPGGFTDPSNESDAHDAVRELMEETSIEISEREIVYVSSMNINDERYRGTKNGVRTHLFIASVKKDEIHPVAGDDLEAVRWFTFEELDDGIEYDYVETLSYNHRILWNELKKHLPKKRKVKKNVAG